MNTSEWDKYFPHFAPEEYLSPGGMELFHRNLIPFDPVLLLTVETLRFNLNYSRNEGFILSDKEITLTINSGDRKLRGFVTPEEWVHDREKEEGQIYSYHLWCAADISSSEVTPYTLFNTAKLFMSFNGIIQYDWGVHLDMRRGEQFIKEKTNGL